MKKKNTIGLNGYERDELENLDKIDKFLYIFGLTVFIICWVTPIVAILVTLIRAIFY